MGHRWVGWRGGGWIGKGCLRSGVPSQQVCKRRGMVPGRGPWNGFLFLGKVDEVTPQVPPALAVLSWCTPDLKDNLYSPRLPGVGLAAAARPASGGNVLRKADLLEHGLGDMGRRRL